MDTSRNRTCSEGNTDDIDSIGLGCALEFFKEYDEVNSLIHQLKDVYCDQAQSERLVERFIYVLNQYQEQPHLLDRYLDDFLNQLLAIARDTKNDRTLQNIAFKFLYVITKVRGYKVVLRHLPHEVSDVEAVLSLLGEQEPGDAGRWESRYVLLLWMSIVVRIPFHMHLLDDGRREPLMDRIMAVIKLYLGVSDKARDAAAFLAAHFVTRPDAREAHLPRYLDWCMQVLGPGGSPSLQAGVLSSLALLFKHGKREDVRPHGGPLLRHILACGFEESPSSVVRKMALKLIQRIGLSFLRTRVASWRYSRGRRSLADNLAPWGDRGAAPPEAEEEGGGGEEEVPDETEDIVEQLLVGLRDKDTIIRWSAAKGVGRVTGRLPEELADDIVTSVLELFSPRESDSAWHGGCLALAELCRRGLVLPGHLRRVVGVSSGALAFEEARGGFSVGAHIRDAACYLCWSLARAYEPRLLRPHVRDLAAALLVTALFDREVTCRRAASAAFQENVGRQGTLPHGIEILTEADYHAVGSRTHCYLRLSVRIARFPEYRPALIGHLLQHKVGHWDPCVRELAARALHRLAPTDPRHMAASAVPLLLERAAAAPGDLHARHGALLALAEVVHALAPPEEGPETIQEILGPAAVSGIRDLVSGLEERGLFRGLGGVLTRCAACHLVEKCSAAALPFHGDRELVGKWQSTLDGCLEHADPAVRAAAVSALPHLCRRFYRPGEEPCARLLREYTGQLRADRMELRCGFALAIGSLPAFVLRGSAREVLVALSRCAGEAEEHPAWAEARRDAVRALASVARTLGVSASSPEGGALGGADVELLFGALLAAADDYTLDSRGEIGAVVREAAMVAVQDVVTLVKESDAPELLSEDLVSRIFCALVQQCTEKIDRTRAVAGGVFSALLHSEPRTPFVPHRAALEAAFPAEACAALNWGSAADTFPRFVLLLDLPPYTRSLLRGLVVSVGGLTESLVRHSSSALVGHLSSRRSDAAFVRRVCAELAAVPGDGERLLLPFLRAAARLLLSGAADWGREFPGELLELGWGAAARSRDPQRIVAAVDLLCGLLQFAEVRRRALNRLAVLLCHRFPRVRRVAASGLYEALLAYDCCRRGGEDEDEPGAEEEEVLALLSETDWGLPVEALRPVRDGLCRRLGLEPPAPRKPPPTA